MRLLEQVCACLIDRAPVCTESGKHGRERHHQSQGSKFNGHATLLSKGVYKVLRTVCIYSVHRPNKAQRR